MKMIFLVVAGTLLARSAMANENVSNFMHPTYPLVDRCERTEVKPIDGAVIQCEGIEGYKNLSPTLLKLRERLMADPVEKEIFELYDKNFTQHLGTSTQSPVFVDGKTYYLINKQSYGFYVNEER